jgi:hypothetical protein
MPTPSTKLGINIFSTADQFSTAAYNNNWQILDGFPGFYICTSTTRPVWGANQYGMRITETDTGLTWMWTGTGWVRNIAAGSALGASGAQARVTRTSNIGTTTTWTPPGTGTLTTAVTQTVHPPNGGRLLMIVAEVPEVGNPSGLSYIVIQRDATILNSYPVWTAQQTGSGNSGKAGSPGNFVTFDVPGEASAVYTLAFAAATVSGGTTTLVAAPTRPISLTVIET